MLNIGFITGSIRQIGSGRAEALPLALGLQQLGCAAYGLELSRFRPERTLVEGLPVRCAPIVAQLARNPVASVGVLARRWSAGPEPASERQLGGYDLAARRALLGLAARLRLDALYVFHNTNVARLLEDVPHPRRVLAINLVGFGIDPSRGGATDTFPLQRLIFERPHWDLHCTATRFEYDQYREVYGRLGLDAQRLLLLPHPYDETIFHPPSAAANSGGSPKPRKLLFPVNVYRRKNIELAIEMLALLRGAADIRLMVSGRIWDPGYHAALLEHARRLGVEEHVHFLGGVSLERMVTLYQEADATVFTSHQETYGHGIIESLGCGTPVVGPAWIIPCNEILSEAEGGYVAPKTAQGFGEAVLRVLGRHHDRGAIAAGARARYGRATVARQFLDAVCAAKLRKYERTATLQAIDWKGLYSDAGSLL
jgi:glycosyltransferase involved in cell wall biosynthesis